MHRRTPIRHSVLTMIVIAAAVTTGCHPAMTTYSDRIQPPPETLAVPLRFANHNFAAHCYNTIGCQVIYNGRYQQEDSADEIAPPPPSANYRKEFWDSVEIDIHNFPPPAVVRWKSLDGMQHDAKVDIAAIFRDQLIWHRVPKADMADFFRGPVAGDPSIFLEVNDNTINVYTKMFIPTRIEQVPGNVHSSFRNDLFLVWTRTY